MRRSLSWSAGVVFLSTVAALAASPERECQSPLVVDRNSIAVGEIERPSDFVYSTTDDGKELYFAGDVLSIDAENFPFFFPPDNLAVPAVQKVTFEARKIIISAPLRFRDASINLYADEIIIRGRGSIGITDVDQPGIKSINILTKRFDLSQSDLTPFATYTRDWQGFRKAKIANQVAGVVHRISVHVDEIILPPGAGSPTYDSKSPTRLIHNLSFDFAKSDPDAWADGYDAVFGTSSAKEYESLLLEKLIWPQIAATHIDEVFSLSPYDPAVRTRLLEYVDRYSTRFALKTDPTATLRLRATRTALDQGLDLRGLSPYDIPMISLKDLLADFKDREASVFGENGYVRSWDEAIVKANSKFAADTQAIRSLRSDEDAAANQIASADVATQTAMDELTGIDNQINAKLQDISADRQRDAGAADDAARHNKVADQINDFGKAGQVVASAIGTFFPVTAPVAFAVGAGLGAASKAIAAHNRGQNLGPAEVVTTLGEVINAQQQYSDKIGKLKQAWSGDPNANDRATKLGLKGAGALALDHIRSGFTKDRDSFQIANAAVQTFLEAERGIEGIVRPEHNAVLPLTSFEQADEKLQADLADLSRLQEQSALTRAKLSQIVVAREQAFNALGFSRSARDALITPKVGDAREAARQLNIAYWYRQRTVQELKNRALNLLRSYTYRTGSSLELPIAMRQAFGPRVSDATTLKMLLAGQTAERLQESRSQMEGAFKNLMQSFELEELKIKELSRRTPKYAALNISKDPKLRSAQQQVFIDEINSEIANQVRSQQDPREIEIPLFVSVGAVDRPDRVVSATVYQAEFENAQALKGFPIRFAVIHPGYGEVQYSGQCSFVRGVSVDGKPIRALYWYNNFPGSAKNLEDWYRAEEANSDGLLVYPFSTIYSLRIEVLGRTQMKGNDLPTLAGIGLAIAGDDGVVTQSTGK